MTTHQGLLLFESTNTALKTERLLKSAGVPCTVIPTPADVTADCGIALLLDDEGVRKAKEILNSSLEGGFRLLYPFVRKTEEQRGDIGR